MKEKKRYLVGYKHSAMVPQNLSVMMNTFVNEKEGVKKIRELKNGQYVVEMSDEEAAKLAEERSELIIEEDKDLELFFPMPGISPRVPTEVELMLDFKVMDEKNGKPITDVTIYCAGTNLTYRGVTDKKGVASVKVFEQNLNRIIASPSDKYWSKVISVPENIKENPHIDITLKEIPIDGSYCWGHLAMKIDKVSQKFTGKGVKIAVIDSGIAPHEDLKATGGYNTLDGQDQNAWNRDDQGHGTHCSGIISAQNNQIGIVGAAPDAEIYSLKVFPGGKFSDLIEAINWCVDNYIDIISMSLGSSSPSSQIETALMEATERGITCIAAAGNNGGEVSYPAAYEHVIAVSAIGMCDTFPEDSAHTLKIGDFFSNDNNYFIARFSNFGPQIDVCAPGVAILSCVPTGYASWDGTSMACPFVSGLAALILEAYPEIRTGDIQQCYHLREILFASAEDIGLPDQMQGAGLPNAELALANALSRCEYEERILSYYRENLKFMLERTKKCSKNLEQALAQLESSVESSGDAS